MYYHASKAFLNLFLTDRIGAVKSVLILHDYIAFFYYDLFSTWLFCYFALCTCSLLLQSNPSTLLLIILFISFISVSHIRNCLRELIFSWFLQNMRVGTFVPQAIMLSWFVFWVVQVTSESLLKHQSSKISKLFPHSHLYHLFIRLS